MAIKAISTTTSSFSSTGWPKEQVTEDAVNQLFVQKFTEIVSSYEERKKAASVGGLAIGPWYANDYALASREHGRENMLDFLVKTHSFYHGLPPRGFRLVSNPETPTKIAPNAYQLQKGVLPTQALDNVNNDQFSFIDCGIGIELARYDTVREFGGEDRFNARFSSVGPTPLKLDPAIIKTPLFSLGLLKEIWFDVHTLSPQFGDNVQFPNIPLYSLRHPHGEAAGFNAVCTSPSSEREKKYIAYGLPVEGKTESGMNGVLIDEFNKKPIDPSLILTKDLADHFYEEHEVPRAQFTAMTGQQIASFTIDRKRFEETVEQTNHQVGLKPVAHRFDIEGIRKYLD